MVTNGVTEFGRCPCSGWFEQRRVDITFTVAGEVATLSEVPQGACPLCGSRVYKARELEAVESLLRGVPLQLRQQRA